jgi:hypothetical protein
MQPRPPIAGATLTELTRVARLDLPAERAGVVGSTADLLYRFTDALDSLDLAEVPPATAFDARWE